MIARGPSGTHTRNAHMMSLTYGGENNCHRDKIYVVFARGMVYLLWSPCLPVFCVGPNLGLTKRNALSMHLELPE